MVWLKVVGIVLVVLACDLAVGAGALIAAGLLSSAGRVALWAGVGSLGSGLLSLTAGLFFVNRAHKWHGAPPWRSLPKGIVPASSLSQRKLLNQAGTSELGQPQRSTEQGLQNIKRGF